MTVEFQGEGKYASQWDAWDDGFTVQAELINDLRGLVQTLLDTVRDQEREIERLRGVTHLAADTIIKCERACWREGQTIPALNTEIRGIVGKFLIEGVSVAAGRPAQGMGQPLRESAQCLERD